MHIKRGCRVKRAGLAHDMNYYVVFAWNRWWIFGSAMLDRVKIHWIIGFSVQRAAVAAAAALASASASVPDIHRDANNEFTIEMHGILSTIVRTARKPGRNGEIKRILDFSIKILFSKNSRHAHAFHNARIALLRFRFLSVQFDTKASTEKQCLEHNNSTIMMI